MIIFEVRNLAIFHNFEVSGMVLKSCCQISSMLLSQRVKHADKIFLLLFESSSVLLLELSQLPAVSILFGSEIIPVRLVKSSEVLSLLLQIGSVMRFNVLTFLKPLFFTFLCSGAQVCVLLVQLGDVSMVPFFLLVHLIQMSKLDVVRLLFHLLNFLHKLMYFGLEALLELFLHLGVLSDLC